MLTRIHHRIALGVLTLAALSAVSCSSKPDAAPPDALARAKDEKVSWPDREKAVDEVWAQQSATPAVARESMKTLAWAAHNPGNVRLKALKYLYEDPSDISHADTRNMMRLMLPVEPNFEVIRFIGDAAGQNAWVEYTGPFVVSYSRKALEPTDDQRPERAALIALHPGESIELIVYHVFSTPAAGKGHDLERAEKARTAAWEVLGRIDADGSKRGAILVSEAASTDPMVVNLRSCYADLHCIPITRAQLEWLNRLRKFDDPKTGPAARAWWDGARAAIATLNAEQLKGLALRHVEPIFWASQQRPAWLAMDRDALSSEIRTRLAGRPQSRRQGGDPASFLDARDSMVWGDLLALLVVDEALKTDGLTKEIFDQADKDRADTSTEYGGILQWEAAANGAAADTSAGGRWVLILYPPRPTQRYGDTRFVASDDMLEGGVRALADYHFHVQSVMNSEYAGPGAGDIEYAQNQGRTCVVFTSIREGVMNAHYYQPAGIAVDLGDIRLPPPSKP